MSDTPSEFYAIVRVVKNTAMLMTPKPRFNRRVFEYWQNALTEFFASTFVSTE